MPIVWAFPATHTRPHIYIYIYITKEIILTFSKKLKKINNPKIEENIMKVNVERFSYNNLLQDVNFVENAVKIAIYV